MAKELLVMINQQVRYLQESKELSTPQYKSVATKGVSQVMVESLKI
jgi:hypothetical protein